MKLPARFMLVIASLLTLVPFAPAYERALTSEAVREAYFLGQGHRSETAELLSHYAYHPALPKRGLYVADIELLTPYAQVVERSSQQTVGYSAQDAESDFKEIRNRIKVRVYANFTPTFQGLNAPADFWNQFDVHLKQKGKKALEPAASSGNVLVSGSDGGSGVIGAAIYDEFDAKQISSDPVNVVVLAPDGQSVTATFDLSELR